MTPVRRLENFVFMKRFFEEELPQIRMVEPEGTYLVWLDCSGLGLDGRELKSLVRDRARLWLDDGKIFGKASEQFQRVNAACPRSVLQKALLQLKTDID